MTEKEFKLCCTLFCKAFEGRKYGEIVKVCHEEDFDTIISMNFTYKSQERHWVFSPVDGLTKKELI